MDKLDHKLLIETLVGPAIGLVVAVLLHLQAGAGIALTMTAWQIQGSETTTPQIDLHRTPDNSPAKQNAPTDPPEKTQDKDVAKPEPELEQEKPKQPEVRLGSTEGTEEPTLEWISHEDFQELLARKSKIMQAAQQKDERPSESAELAMRPERLAGLPSPAVPPSPTAQPNETQDRQPLNPQDLTRPPRRPLPPQAESSTDQVVAPPERNVSPSEQDVAPPTASAAADNSGPAPPKPTKAPQGSDEALATTSTTEPAARPVKEPLPEAEPPQNVDDASADASNAQQADPVQGREETLDVPLSESPATEALTIPQPSNQDQFDAKQPNATTRTTATPANTSLQPPDTIQGDAPDPPNADPINAAKPAPKTSPAPEASPDTTDRALTDEAQLALAEPTPRSVPTPPRPATVGEAGDDEESRPTSAPQTSARSPGTVDFENNRVQPGKVITQEGLEVKTDFIDIPVTTQLFSLPNNPRVRITFEPKTGQVIEHQILQSSGYRDVDFIVIASLYRWKVTGPKLKEFTSPFSSEFTIILRPTD